MILRDIGRGLFGRWIATWLCLALTAPAAAMVARSTWTEAFQVSPADYVWDPPMQKYAEHVSIRPVSGTVRYTALIGAGGKAVRVRLTNEWGVKPLPIGAASIAIEGDAPGTLSGPAMRITFHGTAGIVIPPGAPVLSDPVPLSVKAFDRLVVSVVLTEDTIFKPGGSATMLVSPGDQTLVPHMDNPHSFLGRPLVSGISVQSPQTLPVIVAFGDSLTDGVRATPERLRGYPEELARRIALLPSVKQHVVINAGIGGNRVLKDGSGPGALARFDRDVLRIPNLSHVILLEGINDIGSSGAGAMSFGPLVTSDALIAGYRQLIERAHADNVKVIGATLMPFRGAFYYSPEKDQVRQAVNAWIRTSGEFDGVIDFDAVMRDPADPGQMRSAFDSHDHLHPNDAGYKAMGDAIDLGLFH